MRKIKYIAVHCTASSQRWGETELRAEFKRKGWRHPGYNYIVEAQGVIKQLADDNVVTNGVKGFNSSTINVAWVGGIDLCGRPKDNRTDAQKHCLRELLRILKKRYPDAIIKGHRDFSPDKNGNGVVDPWERIKECPCFDAMVEYKDI
jgi:N-acetylmuramoyl-L-alanine amidase